MRNTQIPLHTLETAVICHIMPSYNALLIYARSLSGKKYILRVYDDCGKIKTEAIMENEENEGNTNS